MKYLTIIFSASVLLTACDSTLTDEQITQRHVNYNIIQICKQKGYFTPQELSHVYSVYPTSTGGVNQVRAEQLAASMSKTKTSSNECQMVRRAAQQSMAQTAQLQSRISNKNYSIPSHYTNCTSYAGVTSCVNY